MAAGSSREARRTSLRTRSTSRTSAVTDAAIVDAGPLVAFFRADDRHHAWAEATLRRLRPPLLTCEPALAEAMHLLRAAPAAQDMILDWTIRGSVQIAFDLGDDVAAVRRLMRKYRDVPMSFADACLVRMAESFDRHA